MHLYLASTSPARLTTLRAAGVEPTVLPSHVDEDAVVAAAERDASLAAPEMVQLLAKAKAEAVIGTRVDGEEIDGFILGCDSAFELDGRIYGKPHHADVARQRWRMQRGRVGLLHTGHWLIDHRRESPSGLTNPGDSNRYSHRALGGVSTATVEFASGISDEEIDAYIATGEPLEVAGAFTIDSLGAAFVARVDGDPHAVVGLSVAMLRQLLLTFDVRWTTLWNRNHL